MYSEEIDQDLFAFGVEYEEVQYKDFLDWFVRVGNIQHFWKYQPTYVLSQCAFLIGAICTFTHAIMGRGRLVYLWFGILIHGLVVEYMSYVVPDIDNFWHSQTPIIFLGHRLPLHIIFLYPCFLYNASIAVSKLRLPKWSEPFAVGLCTVLVDIPYDIVSVNFLHWTWHDTDPNIYDRHYWVPWNSYYFHACFAASFTFWFHFTRRCASNVKGWQSDSFIKEVLCTIIAGVLGTPGGILLFIPIYHPLHDIYKLHSEVTFFIIFTIFLLLSWMGDRISRQKYEIKDFKISGSTWILVSYLVLHYSCFLGIAIFGTPENEVAIGLKEQIGPCAETVPVQTAFGMELSKRKYLCAYDYDEKYFDFHCIDKVPNDGSSWYTACGVPLPNRAELITIVSLICLLAATVFGNLHFNSYGDKIFARKIGAKGGKKNN